jgi:hypothetical protein
MSSHVAFRRQPVEQQVAQNLRTITFPAPTRGIIENENESYMQPGGAIVQDNWAPTVRGVKLRGGYIRWCDLHSLDAPAWQTAHAYTVGQRIFDGVSGTFWDVSVAHTSAATGTFAADRALNPTFWTVAAPATITRLPVISAFEYVSGGTAKMFAANVNKLFDVTASGPILVKGGRTDGNYSAVQMANATGDYLIALNDVGDFALRYDGTTWTTLTGVIGAAGDGISNITYDPTKIPAGVAQGTGLVQVWKYRNRLFFIQAGSMNAWYLPIDSVGGVLQPIPLSGAASKGGKLIFGAVWSLDAGDGTDDKCCFVTDQGEVLIFTGTDPSNATNWRQEGRYHVSPPLGKNASITVGGDLLILTVDGIVPVSQAISKEAGQLELAALTRTIKPLWRENVNAKRDKPWTAKKWDEYGALFVTTPGGPEGSRYCLVANNVTGAWCRFVGYDATCWIRLRADLFFGTQDGIVMQADRTGYDDGEHKKIPYLATLVGGWETFGAPSSQIVWHQSRASFKAAAGEPFQPQLSVTTDYTVTIPPPPNPGPDPGLREVWDQGLWDQARWDQASIGTPPVRNTLWVSIGQTGFAIAPIVQVMVAQVARPNVEMIATAAIYEPAGVNV